MPAAGIKCYTPYLILLPVMIQLFTGSKRFPTWYRLLYFILSGVLPLWTSAQEYNYVRYDTKDGLAGSTVYDICQDRDGFIWFATEAGLSRFDGTRFKNFTTADGLPDAEVLKLYTDHTGRVWIAPFKNTVCYYYQGKIYTAANDSLLKKVKLNTSITGIVGDRDDNILLCRFDAGAYLLQTRKGQEKFMDLTVLYGRKFLHGHPNFTGREGLILSTGDSSFLLVDDHLQPMWSRRLPSKVLITLVRYDSVVKYIDRPMEPNGTFVKYDTSQKQVKTLFITSNEGAWMIDTLRFDRFEEVFLKGKPINSVWIDYEKNIWFGTAGEGVYKLVSRNFKTYFTGNKNAEVFSLAKDNDRILAGVGYNRMYSITGARVDSVSFSQQFSHVLKRYTSNRLMSIKKVTNDDLILGFDLFLFKRSSSGRSIINYTTYPIKSIDEIDRETLLVGTGRNTMRVREKDLRILDTIWPHRSTAVSYYDGKFYVGSVAGLYVVSKEKTSRYLGDSFPALRYRTACFATPADGSLWIATYGGGIVGMKGNRIIGHLTTEQGLSSNICRSLFADKHFLWVGTDKGINKIDLSQPSYPVHHYSIADGLPSNIINTIYVDSNTVYVGSPAGLTYFDESKVSDYSRCDLRILDVSVSGQSRPLQKAYTLDYYDNNLKIEFAGISFKSGGDILYHYRLKGLRDTWDSTRQNLLEYPSLPSGSYQLELLAINKFGVTSNTVVIPFLIETPFWQTWWFKVLIVGLAIGMTVMILTWRFRTVQQREQERATLRQQINSLEQLALRSQMNPHFIFNCLNSIQHFIIKNDLETTNQYLTEFAHLIRQTMDSAEKGTISIDHEVKYLTRYIELEKMRFGHSFDYSIVTDERIDKEFIHIPSMILQPYVENSIRHGIRHKKDGKGLIEIKFEQPGDQLLCIVDDNGIGRENARRFRSRMHVEYQSKGMSLAAERIKALNRQYAESVTIEIVDKTDSLNNPAGTRINIYFPNKLLTKLS